MLSCFYNYSWLNFNMSLNPAIQIDKDFQAKSFQICLFGRLNGSNLPLPFVYRMNGGEVAAQLSMLEQVVRILVKFTGLISMVLFLMRSCLCIWVGYFFWVRPISVSPSYFRSGLKFEVYVQLFCCTGMHFHSASVNGGIEQAQYRQGQKTRHRLGLSTQSVGKGVEGRDVHAMGEMDGPRNGPDKSEHVDDYYCRCGKVRSVALFDVFPSSYL